MNVEVFSFPKLDGDRETVEQEYCKLAIKYRNGENLKPEVLDWMDAANNWLITSEDRR